jgi:hypothetical protein
VQRAEMSRLPTLLRLVKKLGLAPVLASYTLHHNLDQNVHPTEVVIPRSFFGAVTGGRLS